MITGLWETPAGERFSFDGSHYQLVDSPALPKPVQAPRPPVLVGGQGKRRTAALAARFADEFNLPFVDEERTATLFGRVGAAGERAGRDACRGGRQDRPLRRPRSQRLYVQVLDLEDLEHLELVAQQVLGQV